MVDQHEILDETSGTDFVVSSVRITALRSATGALAMKVSSMRLLQGMSERRWRECVANIHMFDGAVRGFVGRCCGRHTSVGRGKEE